MWSMASAIAGRRSSSTSSSAFGTAGRTTRSSATSRAAAISIPAKLHTLNHQGEILKVKGPLNVARPIQGYPVIAQAGSSGPGQDLGARIADLIYTQQKTKDEAIAFYRSVKEHGAKAGRDPDSMLVMPGILPVLGRTRAEAEDKFAQMQDMVHPRVGLPMLAEVFGDLSGHDLDGPLPPPLVGQQRRQERL